MYYLMDLERTLVTGSMMYWKPTRHGYTNHLSEAGQYSKEEAIKLYEQDVDGYTVLIPVHAVNQIKKMWND